LKRQDAAAASTAKAEALPEPLRWLCAQRDLAASNLRGWRAQAGHVRRAGLDLGNLADTIAAGEAELDRLDGEIANAITAIRAERDRRARTRIADQGRRIGEATGGNKP
jgi:hypothetical protein